MPLTIHAPELDGGIAWLNTDRPLSLRELRGSVVILDFWTYCCINCMHVLPVLRAIEEKYRTSPVVVIGVHSGKFDAERDPERIEAAMRRYEIGHPVVVDDDMSIWSQYGIRSWPTLVILRPDGTIAAVAPGEPEFEVLDRFIEKQLDEARKKGTLAADTPEIHLARPASDGALRYPGKVSILPDGRLAVSDSGHHRILLCAPDGTVLHAIGSGLRGLADGPLLFAAFNDPQGTCFHDGALYVADARNHAIRRVDLSQGTVTTVAGTGELGRGLPVGRVPGKLTALRSPWDLASVGDAIYVAMAGSHQIVRFFPAAGEIEVFAGTGVEALGDGAVAESAWAQPSGLSYAGNTLYVADSETSAVRTIDLHEKTVRTLVGKGLFDFGDVDGPADRARLQHALGVATMSGGDVLVADTYNGKIKQITGHGRDVEVRTIVSGLHEPGSIALTEDGAWVIADTNAHRIVRVVGGVVREVAIRNAPLPQQGDVVKAAPGPSLPGGALGWFTTLLSLPDGVGLGPGDGAIELTLQAEPGVELSLGSPVRVALEVSRRSDLLMLAQSSLKLEASGGPSHSLAIPVHVAPLPDTAIEAELLATIDFVGCDARDHTACVPGRVHARVPVRLLTESGTHRLAFRVPLPELEM